MAELDKIKQRSWFLSVDIEDDEAVPCYDTEDERYSTGVDYRIDEDITFKSVKILTRKTQETHPYWEAFLDMSYLNSTELRDVTFKNLPDESGIYMLNIWFDYDGEELNFGDDFKKLCEYRHKWDDGWVCSKCGVRKSDWVETDIKKLQYDKRILNEQQ